MKRPGPALPWPLWLPLVPLLLLLLAELLHIESLALTGSLLVLPCALAAATSVARRDYHTWLERVVVVVTLGTSLIFTTLFLTLLAGAAAGNLRID